VTPSRTAADQAFADKLTKRSPPHPVERIQIEKARKRTKARAPRIAMHIKDPGTGVPTLYPDHSDEEGHQYRLADAFGTCSLQFVSSMLKGLGNATADPSLNMDFGSASPDQIAFNAALAVIDGVRPKDEIECWQRTWLSRILCCSNWWRVHAAPLRATGTRATGSNGWTSLAT
jgi:hypothetical protein